MVDTLQERRRLNEEIEKTFISVAVLSRNIQTFRQTERGIAAMTLYEGFFAEFSLLVLLTSDLSNLKSSRDAVIKAETWLAKKGVPQNADDKYIINRCYEGVETFKEYKKVLSSTGVISMPSR
jgi:hypothetical protein